MSQEELEYNINCSNFLGAELISTDHTEGNEEYCKEMGMDKFIIETWTTPPSMKHLEPLYGFVFFRHAETMLYYSDWNWIMEVVKAIEKLPIKYYVEIKGDGCSIHNVLIKDPDFNVYVKSDKITKKEAVVQAINQFLIWYKEQTL